MKLGEVFSDPDVADLYRYRAPYPGAVFPILRRLLVSPGRIYPYQLSLHPGMSGVVIVGDGQLAEAAPPQSALVAGRATQSGSADGLTAAGAAVALVLTALGAYRIGRRRTHCV